MEAGILGFALSGKTTLFNALTRGRAETGALGGGLNPHLGVARIPDPRLSALAGLFRPQRVVPVEVRLVDIPGGPERGRGLPGPILNFLQRVDGVLAVARAFEDPSVPLPPGGVDPVRDLQEMETELLLTDLGAVERRLERVSAQMKGARPGERPALERERALLERLRTALEGGTPVRALDLAPEERRALAGFHLLTARPLLGVLNLGEEALDRRDALEASARRALAGPGRDAVAVCAQLEMELAHLEPAEERAFRESLGLQENGAEQVLRALYRLLGLVTFFTVVSGEVRAWAVPAGTPAVRAAGKVHSDMERGFIRAEVVAWEDLMRAGSLADARRMGLLRLEGREYEVRDGDVITFRFNL